MGFPKFEGNQFPHTAIETHVSAWGTAGNLFSKEIGSLGFWETKSIGAEEIGFPLASQLNGNQFPPAVIEPLQWEEIGFP
jgi:hypothetical protein